MTVLASPYDFDAWQIHEGLWQGSRPQPDSDISAYDVVVYCAAEHQPVGQLPRDGRPVFAMFVPLREDCFLADDAEWADVHARITADVLRQGSRVLVTCMYGRNRSGLVVTLTLHHLLGWSGLRCLEHVRSKKKDALMCRPMNDYLLSKDGTP